MRQSPSPDLAPDGRASYFSRSELAELLRAQSADAGLAEDLAALTDDTTD